ncbi:NADP oxidoreductase [Parabacteroides faecis]|nr:NADP oxidoreductase [Parabacteroides faecis]
MCTMMNKVKTLDDLRKMRESLRTSLDLREKSNNPEQMVQIKVAMATCGIAAGAKEVMSYFIEALDRERVDALVTQTGCMGYCYAEPTVEITVPGKEPIVFGRVNKTKVDEIITSYIKQGILIDDIIPVNYNSVGPE